MRGALFQAHICGMAGEIPVGAVLLDPRGRVLAQAGNEVERGRDPTAHAEILALRRAALKTGNHRLEDCVLVSTLEPCAMCAAAICAAHISGIVFGAADRERGAVLSRAEYLDGPAAPRPVWHLGGVLAQDCARILRQFFTRLRK